MNTLKRWIPLLIGSTLVVLLLISGLIIFPAFAQGPAGMRGPGMMGGFGYNNNSPSSGYGSGWMMGNTQGYSSSVPCGGGPGSMMGGYGHWGMMGGYGFGGMMGHGMMWNSNSPFFTTTPLTMAEATEAVNTYLTSLNDDNLELGEVMIFDNHAYAEIMEKDTGIGAMEVLIDPQSKAVYPEMGPNMMWNLKYGMMAGFGGYGMMGRSGFNRMMGYSPSTDISADMPVSPKEAVQAAQTYLDTYVGNNLTVDEHADTFYGYYTLHVNRDGETIGMLSVNGYTGQVFLHTWHGELLQMSDSE
jgi:hypothetical protein